MFFAAAGAILVAYQAFFIFKSPRAHITASRLIVGIPYLLYGGALVFLAAIAVVVGCYYWTGISRVLLFWAAFILTRPLGATLGDFLDKPHDEGGLDFSRPLASAILAVFIIACILLIPQRAGRHPRSQPEST